MILTVTINPLLEYRLAYKNTVCGASNRNPVEKYSAGGKGINVSRQLKKLGVDSLAFTFLGGNNGKKIADCLRNESIQFTSVRTTSESRLCPVIIDLNGEKATYFFGNNSQISDKEVDEFKLKMGKMIQNCEYVIFAGSSPCESCDSIFPFGIEVANKYDKISVLDTYGRHLKNCISSSPTIIHNNLNEVIESFKDNTQINLPENIEDFSDEHLQGLFDLFYSSGIKQVYLTNGKLPSNVANFDYRFRVENPLVETLDSTGSGDAFVSGIIYGHYNDMVFDDYLPFAASLGVLNAQSFDVCNVNFDDIEKVKSSIEIFPVGKKMKTIDVTPQK